MTETTHEFKPIDAVLIPASFLAFFASLYYFPRVGWELANQAEAAFPFLDATEWDNAAMSILGFIISISLPRTLAHLMPRR